MAYTDTMLKKKERLTTEAFNRSFSSGKRLHTPHLQIINDSSPTFHAAVVVGKKVYKKAVLRNKLRRQIYNLLYRISKELSLQGTYIVVAKPTSKEVQFAILKEELHTALLEIEKRGLKS